jgi:hypothetical protein
VVFAAGPVVTLHDVINVEVVRALKMKDEEKEERRMIGQRDPHVSKRACPTE